MAVEFGAKFGLVAPDQKTFDYVEGRRKAPKDFDAAVEYWKTLYTDDDATFDDELVLDVSDLAPYVTWGTTPSMGLPYNEAFPEISDHNDERAYEYMELEPGMSFNEIPLEFVFIGSCTNARLEDLMAGAKYIKGRKVADHINAIVVPGSRPVKTQAEEMGLAQMYIDAGFEWRDPGCSACPWFAPDFPDLWPPAFPHSPPCCPDLFWSAGKWFPPDWRGHFAYRP